MPRHHKGFEISVHAEGSPARYRNEIRLRDRSLLTSPTAYASEAAALKAAGKFVEGVDRLMGLGPPERDGRV